MPDYAELQVTSNFSFLRGASHPHELVAAAASLGHRAIAITDRNTLAGIVRAHDAAKRAGLRLVVGARLDLTDGPSLLCFPTDRAAYSRLTRLLTLGKRRAPKGQCLLGLEDVFAHGEGQIVVVVPPERLDATFANTLRMISARFAKRCYLAAHHLYRGKDARRIAQLAGMAANAHAPLVATNDVHAHVPERRALQDVLTCIREKCTIAEAGFRLFANAERHLKPPAEMARLFRAYPEAIARTIEIVERCRFSLDELRYEYPSEATEGRTPQEELVRLTWQGAEAHYKDGVPEKVRALIEKELALIARLNYASYFLTVHHIVRFARDKGILCQGRGSAANSAVCFCLDITAVDPAHHEMVFERFVSAARNEPPDIDVDFEHERREEVIQHIYEKYGREHAGLAATVIHYRARAAIRDVGKAMGLSPDTVSALSGTVWGWSADAIDEDRVREIGLDPKDRTLHLALKLAHELTGFPRHLSQHVGGFVIAKGRLDDLVPIENAAMADRTVIEWDKDDLDTLSMLKVDVLALGMLTCIRKGFDLLERHYGVRHDLASVPWEQSDVYDMLCRADAIGVFQVESRAQMSMLPRLKPRKFYDLVIEVAIVRPGPIQGNMVHPYLRRREEKEKVTYPKEELREVLGKTLGVPLFQEQAMQIAMVAAGFTPDEADELRRAMATFRRSGDIPKFRDKMISGMVANGYDRSFAENCFKQIEGFADYGFPESHAASFARLVYVSAWLKCRYPAVFACALLNSQPMGFYAPAQIVRDARDHGVEVRPVDVNHSHWDCTLEPASPSPRPSPASGRGRTAPSYPDPLSRLREREGPAAKPREGEGRTGHGIGESGADGAWALRLGFRQIKGFAQEDGDRIVAARGDPYTGPLDLARRAGLVPAAIERLARADAWGSAGLERRPALWAAKAVAPTSLPLLAAAERADTAETAPPLPPMRLGEQVVEDYKTLFLSLKAHPLGLLRDTLGAKGVMPASRLGDLPAGKPVRVAGLVLVRQRPGTAKGVIFVTLEDETGIANLVIWPDLFERERRTVMGAKLLCVDGGLQREGQVIHVVARRLIDWTDWLRTLGTGASHSGSTSADPIKRAALDSRSLPYPSRDFH